MTEKDLTKGMKLIKEFMGWKHIEYAWGYTMPALIKIADLNHISIRMSPKRFGTTGGYCKIEYGIVEVQKIFKAQGDLQAAAWLAMIEFLEWYNIINKDWYEDNE